jgi:hypothetical protein
MLIRVLVNPKFAPSLVIGRLFVRNQTPEYVGAQQKKFAWIIGLSLAVVMLALQIIVNAYSPITGLICMICLVFLLFESAFGICLGCKFYPLVHKKKPELCPGEVCDIKNKDDIQKTNLSQWIVVLVFTLLMIGIGFFSHEYLSIPPYDLFGLEN